MTLYSVNIFYPLDRGIEQLEYNSLLLLIVTSIDQYPFDNEK